MDSEKKHHGTGKFVPDPVRIISARQIRESSNFKRSAQ